MSFSTCLAVRGIHGSSDSRVCRRVALLTAFVVLVAFLFIVAMPVRALAADANDGENGPHPAEAQAWEIIDQDGNVLSSSTRASRLTRPSRFPTGSAFKPTRSSAASSRERPRPCAT